MASLSRHIGLFHLTMYGVGLILGAGIYVLIGEAAGFAGNALWISFILGAIVAAFAGLSYSELTALFPRAAAEYVFVKEGFRSDFIGFIIGWLTILTSIIVAATVALGFGGYMQELTNIPILVSALAILGILSFVNFIGIKESAWANTIFAIITISGLAIIIVIGFSFPIEEAEIDYFENPMGFNGIILAFVLVFFAFIGFEDIANVAEEVKRPQRTMPRGIMLSVLITTIIYILVSLASIRIVGWEQLAESSAPLAFVAEQRLGEQGHFILSVIALFATASTILITLVAGARIFYGMARDGSLPSRLGLIHHKTKTPWIAVVLILVTAIGFSFIGDILIVANIVVFAVVVTFAMINLAVILLRYVKPDVERPYRVPVNIGRFPILPLFGLGATIYMATQFELQIILVGLGIIASGAIFYVVYKKRK
ncbi:MAG: amino acid permease [Nitrososphaeria archaeon]|nr:amino acid permease [Nitrosopumilaceae archaeon]NIP09180.1 amino acid permease [Nitrosopumilaceae archaeon]NIP91708.1 amino acid permease [Nitrososphaeria archaeon]NIS95548.1 amino acid permease [Nitrosopumilaceae archaeon]